MEQREARQTSYQNRLQRVGGATLALLAVNTMQVIGVTGMVLERERERTSQSLREQNPAQTEVVELEEPADEAVVQPGDGTATAQEQQEPAVEVLPDLGIEWLPRTVKYWSREIYTAAAEFGVDPQLIAIITAVESGGYHLAVSPAGARGLKQLWGPTERRLAAQIGLQAGDYDIFDPLTNMRLGGREVKNLRERYYNLAKSELELVRMIAIGYNGGEGRVTRYLNGLPIPNETAIYANYVTSLYSERHLPVSSAMDRWLTRGNGQRLVNLAEQELASQGVDWSYITWK